MEVTLSMEPRVEPNPYRAQPHPEPLSAAEAGVEELTIAECWRLVELSRLGRLALEAFDGHPDVFPLNFLVHDGSVFVRSAPGSKLRSMAANPAVAFEVDGSDEKYYWSVVIRAKAERMDTDAEIEASGVLNLVSWSPTSKHDFVRLVPVTVSGRRFPRHLRRTWIRRDLNAQASEQSTAPRSPTDPAPAVGSPEHDKPQPIPHFAPLPH
ncbi:hypothetical protein GCM10017690_25440 [Microbacterium terregens]